MSIRNIGIALVTCLVIIAGIRCADMGDEIAQSVNHAPVITSAGSVTTTVGQRLLYRAVAIDPDGTTPTIWLFNKPSWLSVSTDSIFGVTPDGAVDTSFMVVASDGSLDDTLMVSITVGTVNRAPIVTSTDTASVVQLGHFVYRATASDPDGTTPTISFADFASWLTPDADSIFGQAPSDAVDTSFQVIASDGLLADTLLVSITIIQGVSYSAQLDSVVFRASCAISGCHMGPTPAGGLRLMSYNHLMAGGNSGDVVIPYEPDSSILVMRIEGETLGPRMPYLHDPLADSTIQFIRVWIAQGALDN
jgi:hypothetical protein